MRLELDHVFVCTAPGAPEGEKLVQLGLHEGPSNRHIGQGTSNRRFAFTNAMIELLWVSDPTEAQNQGTMRTLLWERWLGREGKASPLGICVRPRDSKDIEPPFRAWEYRPAYLSHPCFMHIGEGGIEEPMWIYLSFMRRVHHEKRFVEHLIGIREITGLTLTTPIPLRSDAAKKIGQSGILATRTGASTWLEIEFDQNRRKEHMDFRPHLPLVFQL
jgi:hypothetical protein